MKYPIMMLGDLKEVIDRLYEKYGYEQAMYVEYPMSTMCGVIPAVLGAQHCREEKVDGNNGIIISTFIEDTGIEYKSTDTSDNFDLKEFLRKHRENRILNGQT